MDENEKKEDFPWKPYNFCNGNILNSEELEIDHIKQEVPSYKEFENAMNNHHENSS